MSDIKRFLDFPGLAAYDKLIKEYIKTGSTDEIEKLIGELAEIAEKDLAQDAAIKTAQDAIDVLNGDASVEGSVANQVQVAVANLVDGAPEALDTLKEIADWIEGDETGTAALINRVADNEAAIEALQEADVETKEYIDSQDEMYFNSIQAIEDLKINSLFPKKQAAEESVAQAIEAIEEGQALQLVADQVVTDNVVIDKSCYIDANGAVFEGTVTVPADVNVIIENATFSNPVVVA